MTLLAEALALLANFHDCCDGQDLYLGKVRLRSGGNGSGRRYWLIPTILAGVAGEGEAALPVGAVIATARLVNCISTDRSSRQEAASLRQTMEQWGGAHEISFGDYSPGRWAWLLADIVPLEEPIPARGALGLWEWKTAA
jgi:hypothetical protein